MACIQPNGHDLLGTWEAVESALVDASNALGEMSVDTVTQGGKRYPAFTRWREIDTAVDAVLRLVQREQEIERQENDL